VLSYWEHLSSRRTYQGIQPFLMAGVYGCLVGPSQVTGKARRARNHGHHGLSGRGVIGPDPPRTTYDAAALLGTNGEGLGELKTVGHQGLSGRGAVGPDAPNNSSQRSRPP
jgi:hypothetical protein